MPPRHQTIAAVLVALCFATAARGQEFATDEQHIVGDNPHSAAAIPSVPVDASAASANALDTVIQQLESEVATVAPSAPLEVREILDDPRRTVDLTQPTTDLWERIRNGFAIPDLEGPIVASRVNWLRERPQQLKIMVERSRRYLYYIVGELEKRGMPTELAFLPMVESAMNPMAYSPAHASGLWQFIPSTGKHYNLEQNWWYDARRDVVASTKSALDYLQFLYEMHGDWHLALASYNWGENAVARAIERNKAAGLPYDYASLSMPTETRYYVPKLQALKNVVLNPAAYGLDLDTIPNTPYFATVQLTRDIDLKLAARLADMPVEELVALNPGHNRPVAYRKAGVLVLPADRLDTFVRAVASYDKPLTNWRTYSAQRGERVDHIAAAHGISADKLRLVNGIRGAGRLIAPTELLVPTSAAAEIVPGLLYSQASIPVEADTVARRYVVRKGDSWGSIASRFRVKLTDLQSWNGGTKALAAGQRLVVHSTQAASAPKGHTVRVAAKSARKPSPKLQLAKR